MLLGYFDYLVAKRDSVSVDYFPAIPDFVCYVVHDGNGYDRVGKGAGNAAPLVTKLYGVAVLSNVGICRGRE
jgi:hypothetical protein